ncbi:MAG: elongation factor P [Armatimonadota bacterium]|nr:elongation factor P [Armatimonadota bacterium]MCX7778061.1 elongation factor P [Armatimonadota bacterium]MDW8026055.1 elongation factor P [Armatimonadota bacterium]
MITPNDFKPGLTIEYDGDVWMVVEFMHVKPGKGQAFVRTKLRNLRTDSVIERNFRVNEEFEPAHIERRKVQYLYNQGDEFIFMDMNLFEEVVVNREQLGDAVELMPENVEVVLLLHRGNVIGVELPTAVELRVVETEPGVRGDTASGGSKPAKLETGAIIQVPLFVNEGDIIRVDTRSRTYIERVS